MEVREKAKARARARTKANEGCLPACLPEACLQEHGFLGQGLEVESQFLYRQFFSIVRAFTGTDSCRPLIQCATHKWPLLGTVCNAACKMQLACVGGPRDPVEDRLDRCFPRSLAAKRSSSSDRR